MARLGFFLSICLDILETLVHANSRVWFHYHLRPEREKNHLNFATRFNCANSGDRTQAGSTASKSAIHYTIASWCGFINEFGIVPKRVTWL